MSVPMSLVERKCHDSETALCHLCAGPVLRLDARHLGSRGQTLSPSMLLESVQSGRLSAAGGLSADGLLSADGDMLCCADRLRHSRSGAGLQRLRSGPSRCATRRTSGSGTTARRTTGSATRQVATIRRHCSPCGRFREATADLRKSFLLPGAARFVSRIAGDLHFRRQPRCSSSCRTRLEDFTDRQDHLSNFNQIGSQVVQHHLVAQQPRRLIIDEQNVDCLVGHRVVGS